jgi:hypothetical protein
MKIRCVLVLLILLISMTGTALGADEKLKIRNQDGSERTRDQTEKPVRSLEEAKSLNREMEDAGTLSSGDGSEDEEDTEPADSYGYENVEDEEFLRKEVAAGNKMFLVDLGSSIYKEFQESEVKDKNGNTAGLIFTAVTFVPNPYENATIVELYGGYLNICIFLIIMFILGESITRNASRMNNTFGTKYHMQPRKLLGGLAMCLFAIMGNVFYMLLLEIIESLNGFITMPVIPAITPDPEHLFTFLMMGICDLIVMIFFIVRFFMIYIFAVICGVVVTLLVFKISRDFAQNIIEKMLRILAMQPASLFVTSVCILAMDSLPIFLQPLGYVGVTIVIFLTCYYFMFGNFTLIKTGINIAVSKGLVKTGVRVK